MISIPYLSEGSQDVFRAPVAGVYRFTAVSSGGNPNLGATGGKVDLVNGTGCTVFIALMAVGDYITHSGDACVLYGARERDDVPSTLCDC